MLHDKNESVESRNFVDDINFTKDDPCIFVATPPGGCGDLLMSIIDKHYLRTGCEYYGIDDLGKLHFYSTDYHIIKYKMHEYDGRYTSQMHHVNEGIIGTRPHIEIDTQTFKFDQQFFWELAESLGNRNLNYSVLDQVIFGCHMFHDKQVQYILDTFPKAKIIRSYPYDDQATEILYDMNIIKNSPEAIIKEHNTMSLTDDRVLDIPFGAWFTEQNYDQMYKQIIEFLHLKGRVVHWDYVNYYLSKQSKDIAKRLKEYSIFFRYSDSIDV